MTDTAKTAIYAVVAVALVGLAYISRPTLNRDQAVFNDTGEKFYPDLKDANAVKALEVVAFDDKLKHAEPFRVQFKDNKWTIPSHHNYPADAQDRLAKTAGGIIGLQKDSVVSDSKDDHEELGVVDPLESGSESKGWGTRVKLFDQSDNVLADLIVGKDVPEKQGFKYIRIPGKDRVYAVKASDVDLSTKFSDWIDTNLLEVSSAELAKVTLKDYSVNAEEGRIQDRGTTILDKKDNKWQVEGIKPTEQTNEEKARELTTAISDLKIVGVREKPPGLKPDLRAPEAVEQLLAMQNRGFFVLRNGDVVSNEGETIAESDGGIVYTLRFGGVILGTGDEVTAGDDKEKAVADEKKDAKDKKDEKNGPEKVQANRFLLVSVDFDESKFPPIEAPAATPAKPEEAKPEEAKPADSTPAVSKPATKPAESKPAEKKEPEKAPEAKKAETPAKGDTKSEEGAGSEEEEQLDDFDDEEQDEPAAKAEEKAAAAPKAAETKSAPAKESAPKAEAKKAEEKPAAPPKAEAAKEAPAKAEDAAKAKADADAKQKEAEAKRQEAELKRKQEERERKIKDGQKKAKELSDRYANWYYVISEDTFKKIRLTRADLVQEKKPEGEDAAKKDEGIPGFSLPGVPKAAGTPAPKAMEKPAEKPAPKATEKPAPRPTVKAEEKPASKPAAKVEAKPAEKKTEAPAVKKEASPPPAKSSAPEKKVEAKKAG